MPATRADVDIMVVCSKRHLLL